jgi:hypothetical protein
MSEYQYYEFQAVDRPLSKHERAELRTLSTRATITPTRFVNVYNWGNFRGNPSVLMDKYFDAFVYVANWGTHEFMLRLPRRLLDPEVARRYCVGDGARARTTGDVLILEFRSEEEDAFEEEDEEDGYVDGDGADAQDKDEEADFADSDADDGSGWLPSLLPLRAEIASGDLRALFLGWLLCAQTGMLDDDTVEPPPPPGLDHLSASLRAFARFLRVDGDLMAVAAEHSAPLDAAQPSRSELAQWIGGLPDAEKNALLLRLVAEGDPHLGAELLQRFRRADATARDRASDDLAGSRTVEQLLVAAEQRAEARRRAAAKRAAEERARREREQAAARARYLDGLTGREPELWQRVEALIETKRPADYDQAVRLLKDLHDLGARSGQGTTFDARLSQLRERHARKPSFLSRLDQAGLGAIPLT